MNRIAVVGGGPAGMMAAISASKNNKVDLYEKNEKLGKKLFITGKGRCNVTNGAERELFFKSIVSNPRFFMSAYSKFDNLKLIEFFESRRVPLNEERGKRIFPASNKSSDIIKVLVSELEKCNVNVFLNTKISEIKKTNAEFIVHNSSYDKVIIATGGVSYPQTGSTGDGYKFASSFSHSITDISPSLIPIETDDQFHKHLQGLTLKNVRLNAKLKSKLIFSEIGEMLFTHFGISGPLVLSLSSLIEKSKIRQYEISIDLKPGLAIEKLQARIDRDIKQLGAKQVKNIMPKLVPSALVEPVLYYSGVSGEKKASQLSRQERNAIANILKEYKINAVGLRPIDEAIVTRGGVNVKEIKPSTMESKLIEGLYFAGEVIDLDAQTGGYNLQIAFSTGYLAGASC